uniref:cytochrome b n=1 Tax=Venerupis aspera TaxID=2784313 RepID=UPI001BEE7061|nr:cytochrome b [Venerupis aspera]QUA05872.1 cytochrome b [Venerupis aspera]
MKYINRKKNPIVSTISSVIYDLPAPVNLTSAWNYGSLLGMCLVSQITSGLLLSVHYSPSVDGAFLSVVHIMRDVNGGWFLRSLHANGASFFFFFIYLHMGRNLYYHSFHMRKTWMVGCMIFILLMATAFTGYVLPWGQMSYWGATVITNLFGAIPYVGGSLVEWIWGGHCLGDASLKRFFVFHFVCPFLIAGLVTIHIMFLHETGSSNPLGVDSDGEAIPFHNYYLLKDLVMMVAVASCLVLICLLNPDAFLDPTNFIQADPMKTPIHIQPEWYFLFAYSILRSVPNKLGGIMALVCSVFILFFLPFYPKPTFRGIQMNKVSQVIFYSFVGNFFILTFIGMSPVEEPFISVGMLSSVLYFVFFIIYPVSWCYGEVSLYSNGKKCEQVSKVSYMKATHWQKKLSKRGAVFKGV